MLDQNMYDVMREQYILYSRAGNRLYVPPTDQRPNLAQQIVTAVRSLTSKPASVFGQRSVAQSGAAGK
jgi:hypothetical protein